MKETQLIPLDSFLKYEFSSAKLSENFNSDDTGSVRQNVFVKKDVEEKYEVYKRLTT